MTDVHVTQCPQCQTHFRVTTAQLGVAQGDVRCGSCKHVFNAAELLGLSIPTPLPKEPPATVAVTPKPAPVPVSDEEDDVSPIPLATTDASNTEKNELPRVASLLDNDDFDLDRAMAEVPPAPWELGKNLTTSPLASLDGENTPQRQRQELLNALHDEPLQLQRKPQPRWGRRIMWTFLFLVTLAVLPVQYLYLNFDALARQEAWRPWLKQACRVLGCQVPPLVDIEQIRSSNLIVRTHPDRPGALKVDAILYNRASYPQPFPLLELRFADFDGQTLSSVHFKPVDYLEGELSAKDTMPPQTPIHIRLEVLDPGVQAAGYSLEFHSPE